MAAIDYTIPNQFKGLQLESPINAMTQAVQLRNLQEASQMNALRRQEYQRTREEEGAVRNWFASGKKLDSPEALNELYQIAPGLAPGIEKNILERGKTQAETRRTLAQANREDVSARKEQLEFTEKALQSSTTPELAQYHIQQAIERGYVTPEAGAQMMGSVPKDPGQFATWRTNLLVHSMTAKDQLERAEKLQKARYNQYRFDAMSYGDPVLTEAEWLATEQQQPDSARIEQVPAPAEAAPAPGAVEAAPAPTPAPAPGAAEAAPAGATEGSAAPITYQFKKRDFGEGIDPRAAMLLADKPEELAKLMQENYPGSAAFKKRELDSARIQAQIQHQTIMEDIALRSENRQADTAAENARHARVMENLQKQSLAIQADKPNQIANTQVDDYGNITHFNARGEVIQTIPNAGKRSPTIIKAEQAEKNLSRDIERTTKELAEITKDGGLIDQSTGSYLGKAVDIGARVFGQALPGDIAAGKLAPIADMVLKMVPRFEGPQSDKDTRSYKEAAGQLNDSTLPAEIRKEAGRTILRLMKERKDQFMTGDMEFSPSQRRTAPPPPANFVLDKK